MSIPLPPLALPPAASSSSSSPTPPSSILDQTLRTAPLVVIKGTFTFTALGAISGSLLGVVRNLPATPAAFTSGMNTGLFSFGFFSIRDYLLRPLFLTLTPPSPYPVTPSPHLHDLLHSSLSGFLSGTLFSYFVRRSPLTTNLRAGVTLGLGATVVQSATNELDLMRIKVLQWNEERTRIDAALRTEDSITTGKEAPPPTYTRDISSPKPSVPSRETFSERSDRLIGDAWNWGRRKVTSLSPLSKLEEGEYEKVLRGKLGEVEKERESVREEVRRLEGLKSGKVEGV